MTKMTTFKSAIAICGLSQQQATAYFDVSLQSVKNWGSGKTRPPSGVWITLAELYERIRDAADFAANQIDLDGIDPRAFEQIEADTGADQLPGNADSIAGAMALLMLIKDNE